MALNDAFNELANRNSQRAGWQFSGFLLFCLSTKTPRAMGLFTAIDFYLCWSSINSYPEHSWTELDGSPDRDYR